MNKPVILCVDDDRVLLERLNARINDVLGKEFQCAIAHSGEEALKLCEEFVAEDVRLAVAIVDQEMKDGMTGESFLQELHRQKPETLKILTSEEASLEAVRNATNNSRLFRFIRKPWEENDLLLTIDEAARSYLRHEQIKEYNVLLQSLNRATQEISSEINITQLIHRFLRAVVNHTYAERGFVLLAKENGFELAAMVSTNPNDRKTIQAQLENGDHSVIQTLIQNAQAAIPNGKFIQKAALGAELRQKGELKGYLLIENPFSGTTFTENHARIVSMLAGQAVISLENATLYNTLEEKRQEMRQEIENMERLHSRLEAKNKDLVDSLKYAKRIQDTILPDIEFLRQSFPDSFVLYSPRDLISGDVYWWIDKEEEFILAMVEGELSGIPGAFTSLISSNFLNQIISERGVTDPSRIIVELNNRVWNVLQSENTEDENPGLEIGVLYYNKTNKTLTFCSVGQRVFIVHKGEVKMYEGIAGAIGHEFIVSSRKKFNNQEIPIESGDSLYMFTDGFSAQLNGNTQQPLGIEGMIDLLKSIDDVEPFTDRNIVTRIKMRNWQGKNEQTDDAIMIGIRFP